MARYSDANSISHMATKFEVDQRHHQQPTIGTDYSMLVGEADAYRQEAGYQNCSQERQNQF
jgi:hypothetical protein